MTPPLTGTPGTLEFELRRAAEMFRMIAGEAKKQDDAGPFAVALGFAAQLLARAEHVRRMLEECRMTDCCDCMDLRALTGPLGEPPR